MNRHCNIRPAVRGNRAMTLIELMIGAAIGSLVLATAATVSINSSRSFAAMVNYTDLDRASCHTLDVMSRDIREAKGLGSVSASGISFVNMDGSATAYRFNADARTLTRTLNRVSRVMLADCDFARFNVSQRTPSNNFAFFPATNAATAKLVDVSWKCSRVILGRRTTTESVQTARIVIRN
jgi:prepilin-type N-terminal cleavage/methylation domain-containing protein